ncbi:UDP-N-acetylmuramoyl-tripeptide--D-alanyl-D-alanine ligase [Clostridium sp. D2Q-14]|uniref:UDP-N-acetylmuramoyl-tripeptide--D-alanyl-D- alanine ligase n=1 Tax=Anaeromonas gelatinilytica TaxID=2683194 RepID=UPI00193B458D|nr:UDP-N-acetylmuramoyl-tripeptide--D-alanyl-D-alanine ligase [Anaeromonas gelatinilytica]MBS4534331.1 UDP-N-acetylmuramoyl-tripeptide--D-alanyl-D-alanine ligase [Anaeromonas gelatinilytica]
MIKRKLKEIENMIKGQELNNEYNDVYIKGVSTDTRTIKNEQLFIPIIGENFDGHEFIKKAIENGAIATLWDKKHPIPDIDFPFILVDNTLKAIQNLSKAYRDQLDIKVVGITGSNGKTSTKDILSSILNTKYKTYKTQGNLNNELGVPLTLLSLEEDIDFAVIEMGMSSLGEIELLTNLASPNVAIITNIGTAHLQELKTKDNIIKAKLEIVKGLKSNGLFVYHGDDRDLKNAVNTLDIPQKQITFGKNDTNDYVVKMLSCNIDGLNFKIKSIDSPKLFLPMLGNHQIFNASSAIAVARHFGLSFDMINKGLTNIELTGMRSELIHGNGFDILNDSYNSNPDSTKAALNTITSLDNYTQKIIVFGDMLELGEEEINMHKEIGKKIDFTKIDYLFTFGDLAKYAAEEAKNKTSKEKVLSFNDKSKLIDTLKEILKDNSIILLKGSRGMKLEEIAKNLLS